MASKSIWLKDSLGTEYKSLKENIDTDLLIIGGGITGVSILYELRNQNQKICLVDANKIGHGVTSKSTAKINYLQGIVYSKIKNFVGIISAQKYYESQIEAILHIKDIILKEHISCDFEKVSSFLYANEKKLKELKKEYQLLKKWKANVSFHKNYILAKDTYVFHPLKYIEGLISVCLKKKNISIYENTKITTIKKVDSVFLCECGEFRITAQKVVLACHYPFELFPFFLPVRTYIEKSYIMAFPTEYDKKETFITTYPDIVSKRYYHDSQRIYEIILSGSHAICNQLNERKNFSLFLDHHPEYLWSNEDIMTSDAMPFIGEIQTNLYLATGFNTWGMTNGVLSGMILKDLLVNRENIYAPYFDPKRKFTIAQLKQYPLNILMNAKGMLQNKIWKKKKWYKNVSFFHENGKSLATVTEDGVKYTVLTTCPHLGCTLVFNEIEKTWDCPCHASRFDIQGNWIKGPSKKSITYSVSKDK